MREPQEKTVGDFTYRVTPMPASKGLWLSPVLGRSFLPIMAAIGPKPKPGEPPKPSLASVFERMDGRDLVEVCEAFAVCTQYRGQGAKAQFVPLATESKDGVSMQAFDLHFAGEYGVLIDWLEFALETNYGPLGAWLEKRVAAAKAAVEAKAPAASVAQGR